MTNTKFRKRALLSSVAMLLVALIALGSATFAWFVANPTVTASGLVMKTQASPGLTVASASAKAVSADNAFDYSTVLDARTYSSANGFSGPSSDAQNNLMLEPASFDTTVSPVVTSGNGFTVGTIEAAASGNQAKADGAFNPATFYSYRYVSSGNVSTGSGVYYENIYVKTSANAAATDTVDVKAIKVEFTQASEANTNIATGIRVAVTKSDGTLLGVWAPSNAQGTGSPATSKCFDSTASTGATKTATFLTNGATYKENTDTAILSASNDANANYVVVYVYLDGEDKNVYTDNVTTNIAAVLNSLTVTLSTKYATL